MWKAIPIFFLFLFALAAGEKHIVVVVPSYNNRDWAVKNLDSIASQDYENYHVLYIDDASTDGTGEIVQECIRKNDLSLRFTYLRNEKRVGALENIHRAVSMCAPNDIVVTVDGDDWLYHAGVLQRINDAYGDPNVWMTYGQKIEHPTGIAGGAERIPFEVIEKNHFREYDWVSTHLRTFYAGLFQKIERDDFLHEGKFFPVAWDLAFMLPMLEMSGFHSRFLSEVLYVYNVATPLSDRKLHLDQQLFLESVIRKKKKYKPVDSPFGDAPLVAADLRGGLGNQLFQAAAALAFAWDHGAAPIFPSLNRSDLRNEGLKERIFSRLDARKPPRPLSHAFQEREWNSPEKIPFQRDLTLYGYFQSWKHFDHWRERLFAILAPTREIEEEIEEKYSALLEHPNTVAVHVRTFTESLHRSKDHPFLGLEYYRKAMELFPPDALFVVFSDRIGWCKSRFPELGRPSVFIEGNDPALDLFLMARLKHAILCNSTFSWWGAYLNRNGSKRIAAPAHWIHPDRGSIDLDDLYLPGWETIEPDWSQPYPEDMAKYGPTIDDLLFN
jgi:glycosyltransferase involved in cell wall biosynthesis